MSLRLCDVVPTGLCKVDETPKGWYVQYIDRDPETIRRQEEQARKKKHEMDDEERSARFIEEQVRRGRDGKETDVSKPSETELTPAQINRGVRLTCKIIVCVVLLFCRKLQFIQS